ncbi:MAG: hypothetical protein WCP74_01800 [Sphingobacteriia bacterium]|jgi:hypothetical protein
MKQKYENLGLILSRDAQKKLVGGEVEDDGTGAAPPKCGRCEGYMPVCCYSTVDCCYNSAGACCNK